MIGAMPREKDFGLALEQHYRTVTRPVLQGARGCSTVPPGVWSMLVAASWPAAWAAAKP
jgi:hypothetical protein